MFRVSAVLRRYDADVPPTAVGACCGHVLGSYMRVLHTDFCGGRTPRCEIEPVLVASMATTLLEGLVSSALAGNELFESFFRAAGPCLLVEAWRDAGAPRAFDGTALPGWSPDAGHLVATRSPSMKCVPVVSEPSVPYCTS